MKACLSILAPAGALSLLLAACGSGDQGSPGDQASLPEVGVVQVEVRDVALEYELVGRLAPFRSADLRARVPGVLQQRLYEEGSRVDKGQVLFKIDPAPMQAELSRALATLAQAQASGVNAKVAGDRARSLLPDKYISQSDYDAALAAERSAAAAVQAAEAEVQIARNNLAYTTVRSPIAGIAGKQQVTEGALVGQGTATLLATVDQIDPLYVNFSMGVSELQQVRKLRAVSGEAPRIEVVLPDGSVYGHVGVLDFSGDVVDPATGAVALRALVPNPDKLLLPGTFVTLKATLGSVANATPVPKIGLLRDASGAYVLTVDAEGKVARKDVEAKYGKGDNWVVTDGLQGGERVIVSGLQRAEPGQSVKAVPWQAQRKGAPAAKGAVESGD